MGEETLLEVGRLGKAHGIRGEIFVSLTSDRVERVDPGSRLEAQGQWLTVHSSRPSGQRWIVKFAELTDRTTAEGLAGTVLRAEPVNDPDALWVHDLVGSDVVGVDGTHHGRCVAVIANPASDLLELESGALVPAVFVRSIIDSVITIEPPEGLFDLGAG